MNELAVVQIVATIGWLVLAISALASFRMNWKQSVRIALIWFAIFSGVALAFAYLGG